MNKKSTEIRLANCEDGEFSNKPDCVAWTRQLGNYIIDLLGISPKIGINIYGTSNQAYLTIDAYNNIDDRKYVVITILLSKTSIYLPSIEDDQLDLALPGIIDGMCLAKLLLADTQKTSKQTEVLWIS